MGDGGGEGTARGVVLGLFSRGGSEKGRGSDSEIEDVTEDSESFLGGL